MMTLEQEMNMRAAREHAKGIEKGIKKGRAEGIISTCRKLELPREKAFEMLAEDCRMSEEEIQKLLDECWK